MNRPDDPRRSPFAAPALLTRVRTSLAARRHKPPDNRSYQALCERLERLETNAAPPTAHSHEHEELRARLERLEKVVEGLQDAVYRETQRLNDGIAELRSRTEPSAIARALSDDARKRGL